MNQFDRWVIGQINIPGIISTAKGYTLSLLNLTDKAKISLTNCTCIAFSCKLEMCYTDGRFSVDLT